MQTEFILPDIGEGIVECELLAWLVAEGDNIEEDQPVAEVMTDKATVQIPAMHAGTVHRLHYKVGEIAKVHKPLFTLDIEGSPSETGDKIKNSPEILQSTGERLEDFLLPDIGEGIVECEVVKWHVVVGDTVIEDQPVVEVMTDKAVVEIPAKYPGVIAKTYHREGEIAKVHTPLFAIAITDEKPFVASCKEGETEAPVSMPGKVLASPAVRRLARERKIDLTGVKGSGKKGRVLKHDLLNQSPNVAPEQVDNPAPHVSDNVNRVEPMKGIRAAMAKQMSASVQSIPHFSVSDELSMNALIALRHELKPAFEQKGVKLSFMPFFIKALSLALHEFPIVNAQLNEEATELTYFNDHNIGVAVDSKAGLLVPNIKRVQSLSLFEIAIQLQQLISQGREGKLGGDALKGGTISISNIGALGGITATPVINKPEAAIVALGKTQCLPRFDANGNVVEAHIMTVNWSGDHRIIDGATMVKFNNTWCDYLAKPNTMLMHLS